MGGNEPILDGRETLLCVTGGIACYKAADLASKLVQAGAGVTVAMTEAARKFVGPMTFQSLTGRKVYLDMWTVAGNWHAGHVSLTEAADLMIVAPATANIIGKTASGIADDLVSTMALAAAGACPILLAPAMNSRMWSAPVVQENMAKLTARGVHVVGPTEGRLACGATGPGRMAEPAEIMQAAAELLSAACGKSAGKKPKA